MKKKVGRPKGSKNKNPRKLRKSLQSMTKKERIVKLVKYFKSMRRYADAQSKKANGGDVGFSEKNVLMKMKDAL